MNGIGRRTSTRARVCLGREGEGEGRIGGREGRKRKWEGNEKRMIDCQ